MPSTATTREGNEREEIALPGLRAGSLAHAAHTFSPDGESALKGIASVTVRSPAIRDVPTRRWVREYRRLCNSPLIRAWD